MTVYLRPIDAERSQPCCTGCNWAGEPDTDRRAAAAAYAHQQSCSSAPEDDTDTDSGDGGS